MTKLTNTDVWQLLNNAHLAGMNAGYAARPTPMYVAGYPPVEDGVCGFAYIRMPRNTELGRTIARLIRESADNLGVSDRSMQAEFRGWRFGIEKGLSMGVAAFNQSYTRKQAYATAYAQVLVKAGYSGVYVETFLD